MKNAKRIVPVTPDVDIVDEIPGSRAENMRARLRPPRK